MDMLDRMETGRFKVFEHLHDWFEEFRLYHRKDGKVRQGRRRSDGRHALRADDAALCPHGAGTVAVRARSRLSGAGLLLIWRPVRQFLHPAIDQHANSLRPRVAAYLRPLVDDEPSRLSTAVAQSWDRGRSRGDHVLAFSV